MFKQMSGTRFTLFALGDWAERKELGGLHSELLEVVPITDPAAYQAAGLNSGLYLVRPDGYIGFTSKDPAEVQRYLSQVVGLKAALVQV